MLSFSENSAWATFFKGLWGMKNWVMNSSLYTSFSNYFNCPFNYTHRGYFSDLLLHFNCGFKFLPWLNSWNEIRSAHIAWYTCITLASKRLLPSEIYSFNKLLCLLFCWAKVFWTFFPWVNFLDTHSVCSQLSMGVHGSFFFKVFISTSLFKSFFC